jgi:hypothetical protein
MDTLHLLSPELRDKRSIFARSDSDNCGEETLKRD